MDELDLGWWQDTLSEMSMPDEVQEATTEALAWLFENGPQDAEWLETLMNFTRETNMVDAD